MHYKLKIIYYLLIAALYYSNNTFSNKLEASLFLNPANFKNIAETQKHLFSLGFKKVFFTTKDNIQLCGLLLDQSNTKVITHTIIYCAGFYPGTKEGMSSFYALVADQPYNVLLFDARGHNESQGSLWSYRNLQNYGLVEYQDVIAAIHFINDHNQQHNINPDIIIHGICSGAFHTIKAIDHMTQQSCPECKIIKGIIFDSGWLHISDIVQTTIQAEIQKHLNHSYFSWLTKPITYTVHTLYNILFKKHHDQQSRIDQVVQKMTIPIWFVHCKNDPYVPIAPIQKCIKSCDNKPCWWITHDSHANYHTTQHTEYQKNLLHFLQNLDTYSCPQTE